MRGTRLVRTKAGIAPCFSDKYAKIGFQVADLYADKEVLMSRIENVCTIKNVLFENLYHKPQIKPEDIYEELMEYAEILRPYTFSYLRRCLMMRFVRAKKSY